MNKNLEQLEAILEKKEKRSELKKMVIRAHRIDSGEIPVSQADKLISDYIIIGNKKLGEKHYYDALCELRDGLKKINQYGDNHRLNFKEKAITRLYRIADAIVNQPNDDDVYTGQQAINLIKANE